MRIRQCAVRAIVRQPWLFEDPDALSRALIRLVVDVLAVRLSTELDRVGQVTPLGSVAMRLVLPAPVVLALAGEGPASSGGRRLSSFGAEVAARDAAGSALRAALERASFEPATPDLGPSRPEMAATPVARAEQRLAAERPEQSPEPAPGVAAAYLPVPDVGGWQVSAVAATLLALERLGRLPHVLRYLDAALTAEWVRILAGGTEAGPTEARSMGGGRPRSAVAGIETLGRAHLSNRPDAAAPGKPDAPAATAERSTLETPVRRPTEPEIDTTVRNVIAAMEGRADSPAGRLEAVAAAASRLGLAPSDVRVWHAVRQCLGPMISEPSTRSAVDVPALSAPTPSPAAHLPDRRRALTRREWEVASVLPFLLVGPLDELGVLDAVAAALAGPDSADLLIAFAGCLARKALPPPDGGWLLTPEVAATVAAFAGQSDLPSGAATERLGWTMTRWWPVVAEFVTATLVDLRAAEAALVLTRSSGGLVVAGSDGFAPMLWDADTGAVGQLWEDCGRPPVLADPVLVSTSLTALVPTPDPAQSAPLTELVALMEQRPASGRTALIPELDTPLSLLAGIGLSALAWQLWHQHESTHPALALHRFADLDGRVSLESDRVTVRMPLGRRHADLRDHGLLQTVADVPWLGGRRLELLGG